jgi:L-lactate dehydrogenase
MQSASSQSSSSSTAQQGGKHPGVIDCVSYAQGLRVATVEIAHISEELKHEDRFVWVGLYEPDEATGGDPGRICLFLWSSARIGGAPVSEMLAKRDITFDSFPQEVEQEVRYANITIIEGIGASQYGVGMVAAHVAEVILRDERAVLPVGSHNVRYDVATSLPSVVGPGGVSEVIWPATSADETQALERSAATIENAVGNYLGKH